MRIRGRKFGQVAVYGKAAGGGGNPVLTFVSSGTLTSSGGNTIASSSTVNFGNPAYLSTRRVIVVISTASGAVPSAFTIGGINAMPNIVSFADGSSNTVVIASALVTSGTTNQAVSATMTNFGTINYAVYNVDNSTLLSIVPTSSTGNASSATSVSTGTFLQTAGGYVVGSVCYNPGSASGQSISGATLDVNSGGVTIFSIEPIASTVTAAITVNWTNSVGAAIAAACWR